MISMVANPQPPCPRSFQGLALAVLLTFGLTLCLTARADPTQPPARSPTDRPNIVLIFLDDCGYGDFEHTGNPTVRTPNITRLSREGIVLPQFYAASPACSASRYALLTGRSPARSGLGTWVLDARSPRYLHPREQSLARVLKAHGYRTGLFGKWHLGTPNDRNNHSLDALPLAHGFEVFEGTTLSNDGNDSLLLRGPETPGSFVPGYDLVSDRVREDHDLQSTFTGHFTRRALDFITTHAAEPFLVYLPYHMPHLPLNPGREFAGRSRRGPLGDVLEEIDDAVGRIRQRLRELGIEQHTVLVFTSDNGPWVRFHRETTHPYYGDSRLHVGHPGPFRDGKGSTWEGGVRVPAIFCWPGTLPAGGSVLEPASTLDVLPTLASLAGAPLAPEPVRDGRDMMPWLVGDDRATSSAPASARTDGFRFVYTGAGNNRVMAYRRGPWKLHVALSSQLGTDHGFGSVSRERPLLFQVEWDPSETVDFAEREPGKVRELLADIEAFEEDVRRRGTLWSPMDGAERP